MEAEAAGLRGKVAKGELGATPAEAESHLLSLTNGSIICHSMPELQLMDDVLDINEFILDFEVYRHSSSKSLRASA